MGRVITVGRRGQVVQVTNPNGSVSAHIEWAPGFEERINQQINNVQAIIDSEVLRLCAPYAPKDTSALIKSGTLHTEVGSGRVLYQTPYARKQYYIPMNHKEGRTHMWFEKMKQSGGKEKVLNAARRAIDS